MNFLISLLVWDFQKFQTSSTPSNRGVHSLNNITKQLQNLFHNCEIHIMILHFFGQETLTRKKDHIINRYFGKLSDNHGLLLTFQDSQFRHMVCLAFLFLGIPLILGYVYSLLEITCVLINTLSEEKEPIGSLFNHYVSMSYEEFKWGTKN